MRVPLLICLAILNGIFCQLAVGQPAETGTGGTEKTDGQIRDFAIADGYYIGVNRTDKATLYNRATDDAFATYIMDGNHPIIGYINANGYILIKTRRTPAHWFASASPERYFIIIKADNFATGPMPADEFAAKIQELSIADAPWTALTPYSMTGSRILLVLMVAAAFLTFAVPAVLILAALCLTIAPLLKRMFRRSQPTPGKTGNKEQPQ